MKTIEIYLTAIMLFVSISVLAQTDSSSDAYQKFKSSFLLSVKYPEQLTQRCIPTITMMKVRFNEEGTVDTIIFSDSAYPQFVSEVNKKKDEIAFHYLYEDTRRADRQKEWILIPIHIDTDMIGKCSSIVLPFDMKHLYMFSGKPLVGKYYLYEKIHALKGDGFPRL